MKPSAFIGSSVESLEIAYALQESLEYDAEITVWTQGVFAPSQSSLDVLVDALANFDFAIFVFAPDDIIKIRDKEYQSTRDNIVFELGLFVGRLGKKRCFMVMPRGINSFHLPTDLLNLTPATFDSNRTDSNLMAALGPAVNQIRKAMQKIGILEGRVQTTSSQAESVMKVQKVSLQAWNGQYVYAVGGGGGEVLSNRKEIDESAKFDLIELGNNKVQIRAQNGDFVCAVGGGGDRLVANRKKPKEFETFDLYKMENGKVYLRANNGLYVSAAIMGDAIVATEDTRGEHETFRLIRHIETEKE